VLIGGIVAAVVVVGIVAGMARRRRSQDDVHSVEHYHRQLHTLEEMRTHPTAGREEGNGDASFPASTFRVSTSPAVRLTEPGSTVVPPVPPPLVPNPGKTVAFDDSPDTSADTEADTEAVAEADGRANGRPPSLPATFMTGHDDPAMHSINQRPRRLAGPAAAVAVVAVLVAVLVAAGLHSNKPGHKTSNGAATTSHAPTTASTAHAGTHRSSPTHHATTTTTTAPPTVSAPEGVTANAATYRVANTSYSLVLGANNGECWVSATDASTGKVLYTGVLFTGQSETVAATGSVTVVAGAPGAFTAMVDGATVVLPPGAQAPFTLTFVSPSGTGAGATGSTGTGGTAGGAGANGAPAPG
jgi:hypothetical protein